MSYNGITILGSTGSIGTQALQVAENLNIDIFGLCAKTNVELLASQARKFSPRVIAVYDESKYKELKDLVSGTGIKVSAGMEGILEVATVEGAQTTLNSLVGMVGLVPTIEAIKSKKDIALANKETLVTGGKIVMKYASDYGVKIIPVDSEHSAVFQCLQGNNKKDVSRIILTCSGGPFFGKDKEFLRSVTTKQALKHPNWNMGPKISIDSATLMNKGLEIIEAMWIFDVKPSDIDVVIHRESIIHSLVEFVDNSQLAQLGNPDMKLPIQYALTYPKRVPCEVKKFDLAEHGNLTFYKPDYDTFDCLRAAKESITVGGIAPCVVNCANEEAVRLFLDGKIKFTEIGELVYKALNNHKNITEYTLEDVQKYDKWAREFVINEIS